MPSGRKWDVKDPVRPTLWTTHLRYRWAEEDDKKLDECGNLLLVSCESSDYHSAACLVSFLTKFKKLQFLC